MKDVLPVGLQIDLKQFEKYTRNLWCHGLITFQDIVFLNVNTKIPCIGIHEVIAHYINENMPDEYYFKMNEVLKVFGNFFNANYFKNDVVATNVGQFFLSVIDAIKIPFYIRLLIISAKIHQIKYFHMRHQLVDQNIELLQNDIFIHNIQLPSLKHMHRIIEEDCKTIHSLLADGEYNETITWAKQYFVNHPWKLTSETIITNFYILLDSCKNSFNNDQMSSSIKDNIYFFNDTLHYFNAFQRDAMHYIIRYKHVQCLINAAASDDDVIHYLKCSED